MGRDVVWVLQQGLSDDRQAKIWWQFSSEISVCQLSQPGPWTTAGLQSVEMLKKVDLILLTETGQMNLPVRLSGAGKGKVPFLHSFSTSGLHQRCG